MPSVVFVSINSLGPSYWYQSFEFVCHLTIRNFWKEFRSAFVRVHFPKDGGRFLRHTNSMLPVSRTWHVLPLTFFTGLVYLVPKIFIHFCFYVDDMLFSVLLFYLFISLSGSTNLCHLRNSTRYGKQIIFIIDCFTKTTNDTVIRFLFLN